PASRKYGVIELDALIAPLSTLHNLSHIRSVTRALDRYLRYDSSQYASIAQDFNMLRSELTTPVVTTATITPDQCVQETPSIASSDWQGEEWAELAYMEATSLLFAGDYVKDSGKDAVADTYDLARQSQNLAVRALNNRGIAGINYVIYQLHSMKNPVFSG